MQGGYTLKWYASGFRDRSVIDEGVNRYYGNFVNVLEQVAWHVTGTQPYETGHVVILLFGLFGLGAAYWLGAALSSPLGGLLSAVFLWLTPMYHGHAFNNPKDLPFAALSLAAVAAMRWCWDGLPDLPRRQWLTTGLLIGMTMGIRVGGVLYFFYLMLSWAAWIALRRPAAPAVVALAKSGAKVLAVARLVMVAFWPWAQVSPLMAPLRTLKVSSNFVAFPSTVRFMGADVFANRLPRTYVPVWLAVTMPEFYGLVICLAVVACVMAVRDRQRTEARTTAWVFIALLIVTIAFPVGMLVYRRSILFDGIRHILFIVPVLAVLAGVAAADFFDRVRSPALRAVVALALVGGLVLTAVDMARLHPYEGLYFNRIVGGLPGAAGRFETDYWGQSYREGVQWLVANPPAVPAGRRIRVANCSDPFLTGYYLRNRPEFEAVGMEGDPDVVLATTRWSCQTRIPGRVLHVVERLGVPLCYVFDLRN